ncbi:hypothetical protein HMPREF0731_4169 [Pseudoroseomonas cervicalis ATCC 49957]|uniref:Restriction endonuclease type II NgoFVII N-terminal domain-containing protein n=1 Tax=Pseudoroseomonas cervicalis ATCC 49957 TaxID=525371 RepID=D5RSV7_9PROT|nr:hypothetical protein HMPREF0731_4169 [Pseudoroseomonas cervicalis ATCC 49957]
MQNAAEPASMRHAIVDLMREPTEVRIASAYVTRGGCDILLDSLRAAVSAARFQAMPKVLITSFDFGLTEPQALRAWKSLPNASLRVAGSEGIPRGSLLPSRAYHPKLYAFGRDDGTYGVLVGSANLTARGFSINSEAAWSSQLSQEQIAAAFLKAEFGTVPADDDLITAYEALRAARPAPPEVAREALRVEVPVPQNAAMLPWFGDEVAQGRLVPANFGSMWIQAARLQGGSRNQLELPRGGNKFFGFNFNYHHLDDNIRIGEVRLRSGAMEWPDCVVAWHGQINEMERINLPTRFKGGFEYENTCIMFRRLENDVFELIVAPWDSDLSRSWRQASADRNLTFRLGKRARATGRLVGVL